MAVLLAVNLAQLRAERTSAGRGKAERATPHHISVRGEVPGALISYPVNSLAVPPMRDPTAALSVSSSIILCQ